MTDAAPHRLDVDGPVPHDAPLYGLDDTFDEAACVVLPVPVEATVSYRAGTARGPEAIRRASHQLDFCDLDVGDLRRAGIHALAPDPGLGAADRAARAAAERVIDAAAHGRAPPADDLALVDALGERVRSWLAQQTSDLLDLGKLPVVLGGDHSVAQGAIEACATRYPSLGVLQVDAHADLRDAYEGFRFSHASVMHNVLETCPDVRLVSVGLRDVGAPEVKQHADEPRVHWVTDRDLRAARLGGRSLERLREAIAPLPEHVYVSFDIDGLTPDLCPNTGTPVPGGLSFDEAVALLEEVVRSGRRIVGADLCEVSPGVDWDPDDDDAVDRWDAIVGARVLYKIIGFALRSHGRSLD